MWSLETETLHFLMQIVCYNKSQAQTLNNFCIIPLEELLKSTNSKTSQNHRHIIDYEKESTPGDSLHDAEGTWDT